MTRIPERRRAKDERGEVALDVHGLLIGKIACPAYCCTPEGAVRYANDSARRLWGTRPDPDEDGCWDGFTALYRADGSALDKPASPAALAVHTGHAQPPAELVGESADGSRRCVVIHARPVLGADGAIAGVLCSLTDISEQRRLEDQVRFVHDSRAGFLHVLAHELRNLLAPVMAAATLQQRQPGGTNIDRMAGVTARQIRKLARFVDDLLEGSRIEHAFDMPVSRRASNVDEVLAHACDVVGCVLSERGQTLNVAFSPEEQVRSTMLWCDPERLAQALGGALLNASQFSDDGAAISLAVAIDGVFLELLVSDRGIGVEQAEMRRSGRRCSRTCRTGRRPTTKIAARFRAAWTWSRRPWSSMAGKTWTGSFPSPSREVVAGSGVSAKDGPVGEPPHRF